MFVALPASARLSSAAATPAPAPRLPPRVRAPAGAPRGRRVVVTARYEDDDYVELDGENPLGAFSTAFSRALSTTLRALDVVTDAVYQAAPPSLGRSTVDAAVKLGALLLALSFARTVLGVVVTVGTVGLVAYVWSKAGDGGDGGWGR